MSYLSMTGAGSVGETAAFLRERMTAEFALVEEKLRVKDGAGSAFLFFESSSLFTKTVELLALDISGDGKTVTVDAFGHGCGSIWADGDAPPLAAARALRERGFEENERESWKISGDTAGGGEKAVPDAPPIELSELYRPYTNPAGKLDGVDRPESAETEKPRRRRGKRSYDPEL